jgi:hypothetical protein
MISSRRVSTVRWIIRYIAHLLVLSLVVNRSVYFSDWLHIKMLHLNSVGPPQSGAQFFINHFIALSLIPAFVVALVLNLKFRHRPACWVWIPPLLILAVNFALITEFWDHDFAGGLHEFFVRYLQLGTFQAGNGAFGPAWGNLYEHIRVTMPALAGVAYSAGAALAISSPMSRLRAFFAKI